MDKQKTLDAVAKEIENCDVCKIGKSGKAVPGEGNPDAGIVFIGEAPGKTEAKTGRPFVGRSGQLLRSLIREAGLKEEDVFITSPVKYLPAGRHGLPGGTPKPSDIVHGREHLMKQFAVIQPKVIVLLGNVAAQGVLGEKFPVTQVHGKIIEREGRRYLLTFHPAAALRFPIKFKELLKADFVRLKEILRLE